MDLVLLRTPRRTGIAAMLVVAASLLHVVLLPAADSPQSGYAPQADPLAPVTVGPREVVGSRSAGSKAVSGLLGGVLGGSGSSRSDQPRTERDPTRKLDYAPFESRDAGLETGARAAWSEDGLLISTRIEDAEGKGTFQTVFLQTCDGRRLYPARHEIYDLWNESSFSVSWSKTTTSGGQVVGRESGGFSDDWAEGFGVPGAGGVPDLPATWQQLGFDRAAGGARQLGSFFNLDPAELAALGDVALFAHTTLPGRDPVTTAASHWVLRPGAGNAPEVLAPSDQAAWQDWSGRCEVTSPLLLAAAGGVPLATVLADTGAGAAARTGYPLPDDVTVSKPVGTGRTTGHIADLTVRNDGDAPITFPDGPFYIPSSGQYQGYIGAPGKGTVVPPGSAVTVPIMGYCGDVRRPPVPAGEPIPPVEEWIVPGDPAAPVTVPPREGAGAPGRAMIPGTDTGVPRAVSVDHEPLIAAPLLFGAIREIEETTARLQQDGALETPFSGNPDKEREAVIQQTFWIYAAELEGEPYTREDFTARLEAQYEQNSGTPIAAAPPEDRARVQQGADDFWDAFELVGAEAKVLGEPVPAGTTTTGEAQDTDTPLPVAAVEPGCTPDKKLDHTPKTVDVKIAASYGDEDERQKISDGIRKAVEEARETYTTDTPPSTAYSIWGNDHVGGMSSAYAKSVFLEQGRQEWVWSTDPLTTSAKGTGTHTLSFAHGEECTSNVAGAGLMWLKSSSEAFDPLERNIEAFRTLDGVKELVIEYLGRKLPPGLDEALEAGVEAITDPSSDTYAAAKGSATLTVGGDVKADTSENRVVYKRKGKEDKAIAGGGETVKKVFASDVKPNSLTSKLDAEAALEAGAQGNGFAKAYLESLYGTILIGVCECGETVTFEILTDTGIFIKSEYAEGAAKVALREMDEAAERIRRDIKTGDLETTGDKIKARAEEELKKWAESNGGERFKEKPPAEPAKK